MPYLILFLAGVTCGYFLAPEVYTFLQKLEAKWQGLKDWWHK